MGMILTVVFISALMPATVYASEPEDDGVIFFDDDIDILLLRRDLALRRALLGRELGLFPFRRFPVLREAEFFDDDVFVPRRFFAEEEEREFFPRGIERDD
jgi:hypothetical protein